MIECIQNSDCASHFCKDSKCETPGLFDPCNVSTNNCPTSQECNSTTHHCINKDANKPDGQKCLSYKDCAPDNHCVESYCIPRSKPEESCAWKEACVDGYTCVKLESGSKCYKKCDFKPEGKFDCPSGQGCFHVVGLVSGACIPPKISTNAKEGGLDSTVVWIVLCVILVLALIFVYMRKSAKTATPPPIAMNAPSYLTPPTYDAATVIPSVPVLSTQLPNQLPSYDSHSPSASPHYFTRKNN